ncbi:MAG TPA: RluA family pseudouridine synthase, partial [Brevundimonas sp.]|nr:RluA family pseudouridine synthase [Brevundimonas sp.]
MTEDDETTVLEARIETPGVRLDKALAEVFPTLSRARLQALLAEGAISLDGETLTSGSAKARAGLY